MDIVLADAQRLGYAEADPSADVDGFDAAAKLVVLAGIAFQRHLGMPEVPRRSIRPIGQRRFPIRALASAARSVRSRRSRRLMAASTRRSDRRSFRRGRASAGTKVRTTSSRIYGKYGGESSFSGAGAGGPATAVAVVSDLLALTQRRTTARSRGVVAGQLCRTALRCRITCASSSRTGRAFWRPLPTALARQRRQSRRRAAGTRLSQRPAAVCHHRRAVRRGRAARGAGRD